MSQRISVAITATPDEWDRLLAPFRKQGASDPLIAELREALHQAGPKPDWITTRVRDDQLSLDRLRDVVAAAEERARFIETLPAGPKRDEARDCALTAAQQAHTLISELGISPGDSEINVA